MSRHHRRLDDSGSALIEMTLLLPLLVLLTLGILEYGVAWRQSAVAERASSSAGRSAATLADSPMTDYEVLRAVDSAMAGARNAEVMRVIVFRSQSADGAVPEECLTIEPSGFGAFGQSGTCNVYSPEQVASDSLAGFPRGSGANPTCAGGSWDGSWCPTGRNRDRPNPDYVGVHVHIRHKAITSLIPGTDGLEIARTAVYLLEPAGPSSQEPGG